MMAENGSYWLAGRWMVWPPRRLEAGAHGGVDARIIEVQRDVAVGIGDEIFEVQIRLKALQVGVQRRDHGQHHFARIAEHGLVIFELGQLAGERVDLLHLVVNHGDVFGDALGFVNDLLNVHGRVINDPLRAGGERQRQGDEGGYD